MEDRSRLLESKLAESENNLLDAKRELEETRPESEKEAKEESMRLKEDVKKLREELRRLKGDKGRGDYQKVAEERRLQLREVMRNNKEYGGLRGVSNEWWPECVYKNTEWRNGNERDPDVLTLVDEELKEAGRDRRVAEDVTNLRAQVVHRGEVGYKMVITTVPGEDGVVATSSRYVYFVKVSGDKEQQVREAES